MRILYVLDGLFVGGAERNTIALADTLRRRGHAPELCTLSDCTNDALYSDARSKGIPVHALGTKRIYDLRGGARFVLLLRANRYDCVHVQDAYANVIAMMARNLFPIPFLMTQHTETLIDGSRRDRARWRVLYGAARHAYDRAIMVAEALQPGFQTATGFSPDRIRVVHNGVTVESWRIQDAQAARARLGLPERARIILFPAVLRAGKGHDVMRDAMVKYRRTGLEALLLVAGDGPLKQQLSNDYSALGDQVRMLGHRNDIPDLMAASDLVVLPSLSEALPTVLIEAAAAARPVVATSVGGTPEIIDNGVTGRLVPPGDSGSLAEAIIEILRDKERAATMGLAARRRAETCFSIERQADRLLSTYLEVINGGSHAL